jgi:hypothetical protein
LQEVSDKITQPKKDLNNALDAEKEKAKKIKKSQRNPSDGNLSKYSSSDSKLSQRSVNLQQQLIEQERQLKEAENSLSSLFILVIVSILLPILLFITLPKYLQRKEEVRKLKDGVQKIKNGITVNNPNSKLFKKMVNLLPEGKLPLYPKDLKSSSEMNLISLSQLRGDKLTQESHIIHSPTDPSKQIIKNPIKSLRNVQEVGI